jgi:hypothetical protein
MYPSEWVGRRVETLARHHRVVWVEDPYGLISPDEVHTLRGRLQLEQVTVLAVDSAWTLRKQLNSHDPATARLVLVDQSYRLREPHLAPTDAKPNDLVPLKAPDWKPLLDPDAHFRPTIRDFLVYATDDPCWPAEVNIFPYEELARTDPEGFVRAFESYREFGKPLTSPDLVLVGASAAIGIDLIDLTDPMLALELAFHSDEKWQHLTRFFNRRELDQIRQRLQQLPRPIGDLFSSNAETARQALVALIVLSQHSDVPGLEQPGLHLPVLSPALASYSDCTAMAVSEAPSWFIQEEIPRFEALLTSQFLQYLHSRMQLGVQENARRFWERERLSNKLRQLAVYEAAPEHVAGRPGAEAEFSLFALVPQFRDQKRTLEEIVRNVKAALDRLRLTPPKDVKLRHVLDVYDKAEAYRIDSLLGGLNRLIVDIEGPARREWDLVPNFQERWTADVQSCRDLMNRAGRLRDDLDFEFGKLLEARLPELVPAEALTTRMFYERFIGPKRRTADGKIQKALILVIDSMRLDIWRQLIRPALEQDYEIEEQLAFAELPSETVISRTSFFAGKAPSELMPGMKESELLARTIERVHGSSITFSDAPSKRAGMRYYVRGSDGLTFAGVFDFPDVLSHRSDWDRHIIDETLQPFVREIRALLKEAGPETLVFVTADHGHYRREGGSPVFLEGTEDVGYRSAWVAQRVEGEKGRHLFQIPATVLGHNKPGFFVFPKPGFHLRSREVHTTAGRSDASYRHGGLSTAEVIVPLVFLRHRAAPTRLRLSVSLREALIAGQQGRIHVSLSADGDMASPIRLAADTADVEPIMTPGAATTPSSYELKYIPASPGKRQLRIQAWLGETLVADAPLDLDVSPAPVQEDAAKVKLRKLWGDD